MTAHPRHPVPARRQAFSLVELLVVVSIILVLMGLLATGVSAARGSQRKQATQALITKIDRVIQQHYSSYASRAVPGATSTADRASKLRLLAGYELPDSWAAVRAINTGTTGVRRTAPQAAYGGVLTTSTAATISDGYGDAECLFMIVMQGGVGSCLDCDALATIQKGDVDNDGACEFLDAWGQPIRYVLWPSALRLPPVDGDLFFSSTLPFESGTPAFARGGTMRPLVFSGGPQQPYLGPSISASGADVRLGAITNLDAEAAK
jgi:prepilin-type N-terminal cleavage/methylation domain-containing protein